MFSLPIKRILWLQTIIAGAMLFLLAAGALAQVKREHLYKLRDRNRFEGIRTKNWKPVSGEVKLAALYYVDAQWLQQATGAKPDSISVYFHTTMPTDLELSVFNLEQQYFMIPRKSDFTNGWNTFTWPANILRETKMPLDKLSGIVAGQKKKIYFPVCFTRPDRRSKDGVMKAMLIPDKKMVVDIALYGTSSATPLKTWKGQELASDAAFVLELPATLFAGAGQTLVLKTTEKGGREFSHNIYLFP